MKGKKVQTSLMTEIEKENIEIVQLLLSIPNIDLKRIIQTIRYAELYVAVEKGNVRTIHLLLNQPNIDPNYKYRYEYFQDEFSNDYIFRALNVMNSILVKMKN